MSDADRIIFNSTEFAVFDEALEFLLAILAHTIAKIDSQSTHTKPQTSRRVLETTLSNTAHLLSLQKDPTVWDKFVENRLSLGLRLKVNHYRQCEFELPPLA